MAGKGSPAHIDTRNLNAAAGAVYFVVGHGTEGGASAYHLAIAGVTVGTREPRWGEVSAVAGNSGYSIGAIQIDLGQRGEWPVAATGHRPLTAGEQSYVDAIIQQASRHAARHGLAFADDHSALRRDLLSHGDGTGGRSRLRFIDVDTRDAINRWASSGQGKQWIHAHIDHPQVRNATSIAMQMLERHGARIPDRQRFQAITLIAATANQLPSQLPRLERVLAGGGGYQALRDAADGLRERYRFYSGTRAADIAERYQMAYQGNPDSFARAHARVNRIDFNPAAGQDDADVQRALRALAPAPRTPRMPREGATGNVLFRLESNLHVLGYRPATGVVDRPDRRLDPNTRQAIEAFQQANGLWPVDGSASRSTLQAIEREARLLQAGLAAAGAIDEDGRTPVIDGLLGTRTRQALANWQRQHSLLPSGIVDPATRLCMEGSHCGRLPAIDPPAAQSRTNVADALPARDPHQDAAPYSGLDRRIRAAVADAERTLGRRWAAGSERISTCLLLAAIRAGFTDRDEVTVSFSMTSSAAQGAEMVQLQRSQSGGSADPVANRLRIRAADAMAMDVMQACRQIGQLSGGPCQRPVQSGPARQTDGPVLQPRPHDVHR